FKFADPRAEPDPMIHEQETNARTERQSGTQMFTENGKTVFGNWVQTDPGTRSVVTLVYRLPKGTVTMATKKQSILSELYGNTPGTRLTYTLLVQKQSGTNPVDFISSVD